jgi:hypothetical protein
VLDYLAYRYGLLFVVSAGNQFADLETADMASGVFEALDAGDKAKVALRARAFS